MSLIFRGKPEHRSVTADDFPWGSSGTTLRGHMAAGLRLIPLYAAVSLIADSMASMPVKAFRSAANSAGKVALPKQPSLILDPGVEGVTQSTWIHQCMTSLLLRGNAYGVQTAWDVSGYPTKIAWMNPDRVTVDESDGSPRYFYTGKEQNPNLVVHIPAFVLPGSVVGLSPLKLFRVQIETGLQAHQFGRDWFNNGVAPSGKLRNSERIITAGDADIIKRRFREAVANRDLFVTGKDWDYQALTVSAADSQFLNTIEATATQIAAIFRVPPERIGGKAGGSLTYKTLEQNQQELNSQTLLPWATRLEATFNAMLPRPQYVKFNLDALARADLATRLGAYQVALVNGIYTSDQVREFEDMPPLTDVEIENWQKFFGGTAGKAPTVGGSPPAPDPGVPK